MKNENSFAVFIKAKELIRLKNNLFFIHDYQEKQWQIYAVFTV